jgi:hypothetical protein
VAKSNRPRDQEPWWNRLPEHVGGDVIIGNVGSGARGVAIGKNIQQTLDSALGPLTTADKQVIEQRLAAVDDALAANRSQIDPATTAVADFQVKRLKGELTKTEPTQVPNASTITEVGDWLLDNLPQIAESVAGLFATPAVGKIVGRAGEAAVSWARRRFGSAGSTASS